MKKVKKIKTNNIVNIIKKGFLPNLTLSEGKIDSIIREYISEREYGDKFELTDTSKEAISDMLLGIDEMVGDLEIMSHKEENLEDIITDLQGVYDKLKSRLDGVDTNIDTDIDIDVDDI